MKLFSWRHSLSKPLNVLIEKETVKRHSKLYLSQLYTNELYAFHEFFSMFWVWSQQIEMADSCQTSIYYIDCRHATLSIFRYYAVSAWQK